MPKHLTSLATGPQQVQVSGELLDDEQLHRPLGQVIKGPHEHPLTGRSLTPLHLSCHIGSITLDGRLRSLEIRIDALMHADEKLVKAGRDQAIPVEILVRAQALCMGGRRD